MGKREKSKIWFYWNKTGEKPTIRGRKWEATLRGNGCKLKSFGALNEKTYCGEKWTMCLSKGIHSTHQYIFLFLPFHTHTLTFHSVLTVTEQKGTTSSNEYIFGRVALLSLLLFWRQVLFRRNECHNLEGEMISSGAFSCWTEHESLSLFTSSAAVPLGYDWLPSQRKLLNWGLLFWPLKLASLAQFARDFNQLMSGGLLVI